MKTFCVIRVHSRSFAADNGVMAGFPEDLLQTIRAFQESRVFLTAIELDVFSAIGQGADFTRIARKLGTDPRATEMLLNALAALGVLDKHDGVFRNSPAAARYLADGPDSARQAMLHTVHLWTTWSALTDCVRAGTSVRPTERDEDWTQAFIAAMDHNARQRASQVVRAVGTGGVHRMLDVGGGSAAYSIAFAQASESLRAEVLDLPTVVPIAEGHIRRAGLSDRVLVRSGNLRSDKLGKGYDLVFISAICHMLGPHENHDLLARSFEALAPGGRVAIQDFILEADKTRPKFAALFALNMLVGTANGASYSEDEYAAWLREAGFEDVRRVKMDGPAELMIGRRPAA